jgi:chromosomal replication initiator protein
MQKCRPLTFGRLVPLPEIYSAFVAVRRLSDLICAKQFSAIPTPLYLHGPSGTGKTHLASALAEEVIQRSPRSVIAVVSAKEISSPAILPEMDPLDETGGLRHWKSSDLLIVEDLQHLAKGSADLLARLLDDLQARQTPVVLTASVGPRALDIGFRLASRLSSGLVVELQSFSVSSRLAILQQKAQERQLAVPRDVMTWLAEHLQGSGRELEGAVTRLGILSRTKNSFLDVPSVARQFEEEARASRPSVERIVEKVSGYFRISRAQLYSSTRNRKVILPRQLGMYLTRRLTNLSLDKIGHHFGGRDHSTVLHACRKVETALAHDMVLAGTVRQLQAELA